MSDDGSTIIKKILQGREIGIAQWKRVTMLSMASVKRYYFSNMNLLSKESLNASWAHVYFDQRSISP